MTLKPAARTLRAARSRSLDREGDDDPCIRIVTLRPGIRTARHPMRGDAQAHGEPITDAERRRTDGRDAGAISDQKPGIAEIEGEFRGGAARRRDRADKRPEHAADIEPSGLRTAARLGTAFPVTPPRGFRGGRSLRTTMASGGIRAGSAILEGKGLTDRHRFGSGPDRRDRFRCLAAARRPTSSVGRHRRVRGRRFARHQRRTHECRQGNP